MPLPVDFWTTSWADKICTPDFSNGVTVDTSAAGVVLIDLLRPINTVYAQGGIDGFGDDTKLPLDRSAGLFYGKETGGDSAPLPFPFGRSQGAMVSSPFFTQYSVFSPKGDKYRPPFIGMQIKFGGYTDDGTAGPVGTLDSHIIAEAKTDRVANYELWHWQPLTIIGTIAEVIGAMLMYLGADPDTDIDQDSFDDAYDEMISYGNDVYDWPFVWFRAVEGEAVGDSIRRIIDHYTSMLTVTIGGKIAIKTRLHGTPSTEPVTPATVIGDPVITLPLDRITNTANSSFGQWECMWKNSITGYDKEFKADPGREYFSVEEWTPSIELFGARSWNKQTRRDIINGQETEVPAASFPYYYYHFQGAFVIEKMLHTDSSRVSLITVKQGMIGLDYGAGDEITSVDVDSNAEVGGYFWCMSQQVDFNSLTVVNIIQDEHVVVQP